MGPSLLGMLLADPALVAEADLCWFRVVRPSPAECAPDHLGVKGASNDVPFTTSIVVMLATNALGLRKCDLADPDNFDAHADAVHVDRCVAEPRMSDDQSHIPASNVTTGSSAMLVVLPISTNA